MYNKKIKRNLYIIFFITIFLSIVVLFTGTRVIKFLDYASYDNVENRLETKTEAYKIQVERQIDSDVQTLITISSFLKINNFGDLSILYNILHEANNKNHFIGMYSIYNNELGIESIINKEEANYIKLDEIEPELQKIYKESINGNIGISDVFFSDYLKNNVFAISVPIYGENDSDIEGVLIAYDTSDQFYESLNISIEADEEKDYVNMIESNGDFL